MRIKKLIRSSRTVSTSQQLVAKALDEFTDSGLLYRKDLREIEIQEF